MTSYYFDPVAAAWVVLGLVLGLLLGRLIWGRAARRYRLAAESVSNAAATAAARTQADQVQRELAASQAAMRPLADEVDRLKRELAKAKRPAQAALPGMGAARPLEPLSPLSPLPPRSAALPPHVAPPPHVEPGEAMAGTGPIVVDDGSMASVASAAPPTPVAPGIRALKGVGDRFGAALEAIGLGTIDRIARLNADEAVDADTRLGTFNGRIARDQLVDQAVLLDEGRTTEYEARFGKLGGPVLV